MGIYDEQIVSDHDDLMALTMDGLRRMTGEVQAGLSFEESSFEDTPANRRVYANTEHNVAVMRKYGAMIDHPFAN